MQNVIDILEQDHQKVLQLIDQVRELEPREAKEILAQIEQELKIHSKVEEELVYPAFKNVAGEGEEGVDLFYESIEEHHVVDMVMPELKAIISDRDRFRAKATVLKELIEHHAGEEEESMFPTLREKLPAAEMQSLTQKVIERRQELQKQWEGTITGAMRKVQSAAEKFMPSSIKDESRNRP
jgi:hemerythrin superfamily protein